MGRKVCRDCIFKLVYQQLFAEDMEPAAALDAIDSNLEVEDQKYILQNYNDIMSHYEEITDIISKATEGYVIKRIYKVDLAILVDAIYEIKYLNEPVPVIINEAVELAKKYSNEKSPSFINGVLSKIVNNK
jgi:N utilization substance protein B